MHTTAEEKARVLLIEQWSNCIPEYLDIPLHWLKVDGLKSPSLSMKWVRQFY
jgi:hypothetical protein